MLPKTYKVGAILVLLAVLAIGMPVLALNWKHNEDSGSYSYVSVRGIYYNDVHAISTSHYIKVWNIPLDGDGPDFIVGVAALKTPQHTIIKTHAFYMPGTWRVNYSFVHADKGRAITYTLIAAEGEFDAKAIIYLP